MLQLRATSRHLDHFVGVLLLVALLLSGATPTFAHASLLGSEPPTGAILETSPREIALTFSEPAGALAMRLIDRDGSVTSLDEGAVSSEGPRLLVSLPTDLAEGTHVLSWRAASSDGHPIAGTITFSVGVVSDNAPAGEPTDLVVRIALWLARATMLITLLLGAGSSGFRMVASALPARAGQSALIAMAVGGIAAILSVPLHGLDALGRPLSDIVAWRVWAVTMNAGYGASVVAALIALALASIAVAARKPSLAGWISVLSLVAIGLTATLSGHASSADPRWLTRAMIFAHVVSIAWWAGELLPLGFILRQSHAIADPPLMQFSRFIPFVIAPLVVSGLTLAVIQLGPPGAAWWTAYTYLFAAKLVLLLVLFAVAAWNRWHLTAKVMAGQEAATRHLRRAILIEILLIVSIVGVAAGWRFTPPPRSLAVAAATVLSLEFAQSDLRVHATIFPARVGHNSVSLVLSQGGEPAQVSTVRAFLSNEELGIGKLPINGTGSEGGVSHTGDVIIPAAGNWTLTVEVRISDFAQTRASVALGIPDVAN